MSARRLVAAAPVVLAALVIAAPGLRADDGPVYLDELQEKPDTATVERISGWSGFFASGSRTRTGDFHLNETIFAPGLHLQTAGGFFERRLADFRAGATLSLQHRTLSGAADRSDDLYFEDFAGDVNLLPQKPLRFRLSGNRSHGWNSSPYKSSIRTRSTVWGAGADLDAAVFPASVTWTREEYLEEELDLDRITTRNRLRFGVKRPIGPVRSSLTMRHERFEKNVQRQDYRTDGADWRVAYRPRRELGLGGTLRWLHRYGSRRATDLSTRATGRWEVRPGLEARSELGWRRLRPGGRETPLTNSSSGDLSVRHLLWGSLETTVGAHRLDETSRLDDEETGALRRTGGRVRLDYRRRLQGGTLQLATGVDRSRQERTGRETERAVANEEHVLPELAEIRLEHPGVVAGSVIVTDASGFVVYDEGLDYRVTEAAGFIFLARTPTGSIAADERIRVDYRYTLSPDLTFDAHTWNLSARFDARRSWSVWIRRRNTDETRVSGTADAGLRDETRTAGGGLLRRGPVTVSEEYENLQVADTRFRTNRLQLNARFLPGGRWRTALAAGHTWSRTEWPRRTQRYLTLGARAAWTSVRGATASLESWFRWNDHEGEPGTPDDGLYGGRFRYEQRWRSLVLDAQVSLQITDRNEIDDRRLVFRTGLRRVF